MAGTILRISFLPFLFLGFDDRGFIFNELRHDAIREKQKYVARESLNRVCNYSRMFDRRDVVSETNATTYGKILIH